MVRACRVPRPWLAVPAVALLVGSLVLSVEAQTYPSKPIRLLVGYQAGSSIDTVARIMAEHLRVKLGTAVTVENRTGANGMLAATEVARSAPDGHTLLISNASTLTINPIVYKKIQYNVERDFALVTLIVSTPMFAVINPENPRTAGVASLADLVKLAKDKPGQINYGSSGVGSVPQIATELLNHLAGVKMTHVPYRGAAGAQLGLLAKDVDWTFDNPAAMSQIKAGKLKPIAVTSAQRWRDLPDVPTFAEAGFSGYDVTFWSAAVAPAGTPPAVVKMLSEAITSAKDVPATRTLLAAQGNIEMLPPEQFARRVKHETEQYAATIKQANIQVME